MTELPGRALARELGEHFMEGKFQIDFYCGTPETQQPVEEALDYLRHQVGGIR